MTFHRRRLLALATATLAGGSAAFARWMADDESILKALGKIREDAKLPGVTAAIVEPGKALRLAAVGIRKEGSPEPFGSSDLVHLGSCTKAMTATMIATLVEEGKLSWTSTLADIFPKTKIHEKYRPVTLTQLLSHRAGLPANSPWLGMARTKSTTEQRTITLQRVTSAAPPTPPGEKMVYSNVGYALAALMAETVTKSSWEDLMRERLFRPLGMDSAGFGPPGATGKVDQPWGHARIGGKLVPSQIDNAPALGPAGTVHCTMSDWAKFAELHIQGGRGEKTAVLKPESFVTLHTPAKGESYAKGWVPAERPWAGGTALMHNGSNTQWYSLIWLASKKNVGFLAVANLGGDDATHATDKAIEAMIGMRR